MPSVQKGRARAELTPAVPMAYTGQRRPLNRSREALGHCRLRSKVLTVRDHQFRRLEQHPMEIQNKP
ncbi:hypothetical protein BDV23DRAFT_160365 [Aspergillus alliaceus]|uniref:Uncharacterized protein n=1 Tax=Petromyces alliaceus TaxID=209559 RepID=A0A5N7C188_PETAA|nr:hypothetical protein BDV23DRAFT_160365 [Aspergillus alliaceus]